MAPKRESNKLKEIKSKKANANDSQNMGTPHVKEETKEQDSPNRKVT